ncbi:MAG: 2-hydroxychromene-2-carboxylate isomerase [Deltaproteobacteria bacterium]|nr:2-hydroxychromene-2-carboxylate isomerase [Deltaproteobacteria bacterium]
MSDPLPRSHSERRSGALRSLEFWFDFSCPYAYLASTQVEALAARARVELVLSPMLLGGVFRAWGTPQNLSNVLAEAEQRHAEADRRRFATLFGVPLHMPSGHPIRTVEALRVLLASPREHWLGLMHAFFRAYWVENRDVSSREVSAQVLAAQGLDAQEILDRSKAPAVKSELRRRTDQAIELGIFGAPSFVVGAELYWGQDRLEQVEKALSGGSAPSGPLPRHESASRRGGAGWKCELFLDLSDPFAPLAIREIDRLGLSARITPISLPPRAHNAAKERLRRSDLLRRSREMGLEVAWERFSTSGSEVANSLVWRSKDVDAGARLIASAQGLDLADRNAVAHELGVDPKQLEEGQGARVLAQERALASGVFASPTLVVTGPNSERALYAGADRFFLARRVVEGELDFL